MDLITLAMLKSYVDGKNLLGLEVETILAETTVPVEDGSCRVALSQKIGYGVHNVRVNGTMFEVFCDGATGYHEENTIYINIEKEYVLVVFNPHVNDPESVPKYATVSVQKESIPIKYIPAFLMPVYVDLDHYGIGEVILQLVLEGGGGASLENVGNFWDITSGPTSGFTSDVRLTMEYQGLNLDIRGVSRIMNKDACVQVCFTCPVVIEESFVTIITSICPIAGNTNGANVNVKVT